MSKQLPIEVLRAVLEYTPWTGQLFWKPRPSGLCASEAAWKRWNTQFAGREAGSVMVQGYLRVSIFDVAYKLHCVAWALHYGYWPKGQLDHRDRDPGNNRIDNLREATPTQNGQNRKAHRDGKSSFHGVTWHKQSGKWMSRIQVGGVRHQIGMFATEEEAARAYDACAVRCFGDFANPNFTQ